jgi:uncharacterized protein with HEPN domain
MAKGDRARLGHMLDAAHEAVEFMRGRAREDLDRDRKLNLSIVRLLEIIGEAARQVSQPTRDQHPGIPWLDITDMRNRLAHGYADINLDVVWNVIASALPRLIGELERILSTKE